MSISGSCLLESVKCPGKPLIALPDRPCGPINPLLLVQLNQGLIPPVSMRRQLGSLWLAWVHSVILRVVPSIVPEIRYGGWYRNHICTLRLSTVFKYIDGTTPQIDLFQFFCMASRSLCWNKVNSESCILVSREDNNGYLFCISCSFDSGWRRVNKIMFFSIVTQSVTLLTCSWVVNGYLTKKERCTIDSPLRKTQYLVWALGLCHTLPNAMASSPGHQDSDYSPSFTFT